MRHVIFAHDDDRGFAERNPVAAGNFILAACLTGI
jgi:hypothetical protein